MINISGYVNENNKINKNKTWFSVKYNVLVSRELSYRNYFTILSRYENNTMNYFLLLSDEKLDGCGNVKQDDYGRIKIHLNERNKSVFGLNNLKEDVNVEIAKIDGDSDCELYSLYPNL